MGRFKDIVQQESLKKIFKFVDGTWTPMDMLALQKVSLDDIFSGKCRIMAEVYYQGKPVYVTVNEGDYISVKKKYPNAPVVALDQMFKIFCGTLDKEYYEHALPTVLYTLSLFPGAEVTSVKNTVDHNK